ncbi:MAG TPA: DNRLRE domain-containing protein [Candidatus Saccharimonadales bacterium]|nr:DNRLRE domain-containing protein [Candidatus Saccharimonadales bacterium]
MKITSLLVALLLVSPPAAAATVTVEASKDATLIESPDGSLANGSGPVFFVGRTNQPANSIRRALICFDLSAALPREAKIEHVALRFQMTPSNPAPRTIHLHRVLAEWGEGESAASGGGGATAGTGDVTWIHTFWNTAFWEHPGGQFVASASGSLLVGDAGPYTLDDEGGLTRDVRLWAASPGRNFGWILIADETAPQSVKSFASREDTDPAARPELQITYSLPGTPSRR